MSVYVAKSTDSSAPTLSGTAGDLTNLLDKLLCDGFGSYTAPGWEKEYTNTNKRVYRAPSGNRFRLRVDDTGSGSASYARVVGYETMGSIDDDTGNAFPTDAQISGGMYAYKSSTADSTTRVWYFFSDGKIFYLCAKYDGTYYNGLCFGDIVSYTTGDAYNTILIASEGTSSAARFARLFIVTSLPTATGNIGNYIARIYTQAAGAAKFSKYAPYQSSSASDSQTCGSQGLITYPAPASGGLILARTLLWEPTLAHGIRGRLPGYWAPGHTQPLTHGDTFTGAAGSDIAGRTFIVISPLYNSGQIFFETSDTWD